MIRKIGKKTSAALIAGILAGMAALMALISCGDDEVLALDPDTYDTVVAFRVNRTGDGFRNIGTGGNTYTATAVGGSFTTSAGRRVFDTGGTDTGETWYVPWTNDPAWKKYTNIGYVELSASVGDLLAASEEWTVETVFALPGDHRGDIVDQYVWGFYNYASPSDAYPANILGFCWRELYMRIIPGYDEAAIAPGGWDGTRAIASTAVGNWAHLVVTKTSDGTVTIYVNGTESNHQTVNYPTNFTAGLFVQNYLGKTPYPVGGAMDSDWFPAANGGLAGEGTYGENLVNTGYYHFAIDDKAWDAGEVATRFSDSPVGKGQLIVW